VRQRWRQWRQPKPRWVQTANLVLQLLPMPGPPGCVNSYDIAGHHGGFTASVVDEAMPQRSIKFQQQSRCSCTAEVAAAQRHETSKAICAPNIHCREFRNSLKCMEFKVSGHFRRPQPSLSTCVSCTIRLHAAFPLRWCQIFTDECIHVCIAFQKWRTTTLCAAGY